MLQKMRSNLGELANLAKIAIPLPIRTPRLILRAKQAGDGALSAAAVHESWEDLHQWMQWAENREVFTVEAQETRIRQSLKSLERREVIDLIGVEAATGDAVIWCGLHDIDWQAHVCDTGYWVRKSAQGRGIAKEAANAMVRYAFGALAMQRVGLTHSAGNEASRRIAERLGFAFEGVQRNANLLPGGRFADRLCYARVDLEGLPPLDVRWGCDL